MTISDEAIEAAAKAAGLVFDEPANARDIEYMRTILEAAAPFIRAGALEEAAADVDLPGSSASGYYASEQDSGYREAERHVEAWLRNRAYAEMRRG